MLPRQLLHPDHVVPASEFVGALPEQARSAVAHVFVEIGAVGREVFVRLIRIGDARIEVLDALGLQPFLEGRIERPAEAPPPTAPVEVYGNSQDQS